MGLELRLEMKLRQELKMTPQLQQAIRLLQVSRVELLGAVREELLENPMLEEQSELSATEAHMETVAELAKKEASEDQTLQVSGEASVEQAEQQIDWEAYIENYSSPTPGSGPQRLRDDDLPGIEATMTKRESLADHLMWQLQVSDFSEQEERVAALIIGNLDDHGYLREISIEQLAEQLDQDVEYVLEVLEMVQRLDPLGVGARTLEECLLIQARFHDLGAIVEDIITDHLGNLERRNPQIIARELDIERSEVIEAAKLISELEPRPGRPFSGDEPRYITPDIYIRKVDGEYRAFLNEDGLPKLRISQFYRNALAKQGDKSTKKYVTDRLNSAQWLIRSIQQRQQTIQKVTESIIGFQNAFFDHGVEALKPLILRNVADDIGMHESTVSRVTTNKYVHTPQGIFELKFFFNSSIQGARGRDLASEAVKSKIRTLIAKEDPCRPFSDQKLVELLKKDEVKIARRTVAKYREAMLILPSSKRKRLS